MHATLIHLLNLLFFGRRFLCIAVLYLVVFEHIVLRYLDRYSRNKSNKFRKLFFLPSFLIIALFKFDVLIVQFIEIVQTIFQIDETFGFDSFTNLQFFPFY